MRELLPGKDDCGPCEGRCANDEQASPGIPRLVVEVGVTGLERRHVRLLPIVTKVTEFVRVRLTFLPRTAAASLFEEFA